MWIDNDDFLEATTALGLVWGVFARALGAGLAAALGLPLAFVFQALVPPLA